MHDAVLGCLSPSVSVATPRRLITSHSLCARRIAVERPNTPKLNDRATMSYQSTVLIVDDDPSVREILAALLQNQGYHLVLAANGAEALEQAASSGQMSSCSIS